MRAEAVPAFVDEPAEIEYRNGMFYVTDAMGFRALRPIVVLKNFERTAKAIQIYHGLEAAEPAVIPFPDRIANRH